MAAVNILYEELHEKYLRKCTKYVS